MIIGLDGATFDVIKPMVQAGRLPTIAKLMAEGSWGELRSTIIPITPPAWASFMTGKNPGKHGLFGFYDSSDGSYQSQVVTGRAIRAKKIWDYCNKERIGLIDIPMTYPPEKINGYMISGWPVPSDESIFTSPPELHTEIISRIGEYMIDKTFMNRAKGNPIEALGYLYKYTDMRKNASLYLLKNKGPLDLFVAVFRGTDFIQHEGFKFHDATFCKTNPEISKKFKDIIFQYYERIDSIIAELIKAMGEDAITIIMSDHGGGPMEKKFYINRWLMKEGFLVLKKGSTKGIRVGRKSVSQLLERIGAAHLNNFLPMLLKQIRIPYARPYKKDPLERVCWKRTKAFANFNRTDGVIRINLKGREPEGIVDQEDYNRAGNEIIEKLMCVVDPENGNQVVQQAYRREDVYKGPYVNNAPDILVLTKNISYVFGHSIDDGDILERPSDPAPAPHRMEGIFIANGPHIKKGKVISGLNITDIAPTVLYLLGKPIPDSMDGRVIDGAIDEDYSKTNPPQYYAEGDEVGAPQSNHEEFSTEEKSMIEKSLKALGYME